AEMAWRAEVDHDLLLVDIRDIHRVFRRSPRDAAIVAEDDKRDAGEAVADDVERSGAQVVRIPNRGNTECEVRIVRDQRGGGDRMLAAHGPFVRAGVTLALEISPDEGQVVDAVVILARQREA